MVTLERNEMLARVAARIFSRMGVANVDVVNASAEEYLRRDGLRFDWIYADPDRRSDKGRKLVRLEDCSPDIVALEAASEAGFGASVRQELPAVRRRRGPPALSRQPRGGARARRRMQEGRGL